MRNKNNTPLNKIQSQGTQKDYSKQLMEAYKINPAFNDLTNPNLFVSHIQGISEALKNNPETNKERLSEILKGLEVKATEQLHPPLVAWEQVNGSESSILGTLGNFSLIIGKAKSRKSFFINIAISAVLKIDALLNQFRGRLPHDKRKVLYFDTEQGKYHVQLALKRVCKQINTDIPEDLIVYHLRSKKPSERLVLIEHAIYNTENLGFVVIDGIKDLVTSINDEAEATMIASKLLKWTEEKDIHIVTVLHQNKSDNNARGHIGTELINKAETVLSVTKNEQDNDISIVEAQQCRNREPNPFAFEINEDGLPVLVENFEVRTETRKNKFDVSDLEDYKVYELLSAIYSNGNRFNYSELVIQMKLAYKDAFNKSLGDNRAKSLITISKNNDWIVQEKPKAPYTIGDYNNTSIDEND